MKLQKLLKLLLAVVLTCVLCATLVPTFAVAEELSDSLLLVLDKGKMEDNRVEIVATLTKNSGATGVILTLNYDEAALKLVEVTEGEALSSLSCTRTPTYSSPYKILYMKADDFYRNDKSTGVLLRFVFEIRDMTRDGEYKITLKAEKNGVQYAENDQFKSKNLLSNPTTISVKGQQTSVEVLPTDDVEEDDPKGTSGSDLWKVLIPVVVAGALVITFMVLLVVKIGNGRKK